MKKRVFGMFVRMTVVVTIALAVGSLAQSPRSSCGGPEERYEYPAISSSPLESFRTHDAVFWGEVTVPSRPCSLGSCAGLTVLKSLKGPLSPKILVRVPQPKGGGCPSSLFAQVGSKWLVFANTGTSRTGYAYYQVDADGPSFMAATMPDIQRLEANFGRLRTALDEVISRQLGGPRPL